MRFRALDVATAVGGRLVGVDVELDGVAFDSREIRPGQLFVPVVAARDGHDFVDDAVARGASAYLSSRSVGAVAGGVAAIVVDDTSAALMRLAEVLRGRLAATVVGITGSVGKTSTKDLARAAIGASRRTWANERSFNNEQGLPTTLLATPDDSEVVVLEMGMRGLGQITALCDIARPHVGVVTRVAEAHSDLVGGIEGVARAKSELVRALPADGTAVLNADDEHVVAMRAVTAARVLTFGRSPVADVAVSGLVLDEEARPRFTLSTPWGRHAVRLAVSGAHMAMNAAAAIAVAGAVGADVAAGVAAVASVPPGAMRMHVRSTLSGAVVLDDSYNANPTSTRAAIDALVALPARRRFAVLGVMAEISDAPAAHRAVAAYAADRGVRVIAVGTDLYDVTPVADAAQAREVLGSVAAGDAVLVKGSRVAALDRLADLLCG